MYFPSLYPSYAAAHNLALNKQAFQSTTVLPGVPGLAVDGNKTTGSCSLTRPGSGSASAWWVVDLGDTYVITEVHVTSRADTGGQ